MSIQVAAGLARRGRRVLLLDMDPQGSASNWAVGTRNEVSMAHFLVRPDVDVKTLVVSTNMGFDIVPGGQFTKSAYSQIQAAADPTAMFVLQDRLVPLEDSYDDIIADTPPSLGQAQTLTLSFVEQMLLIASCEPMSAISIEDSLKMWDQFRNPRLNKDLKLLGILPTKLDKRYRAYKGILKAYQSAYPEKILEPMRITSAYDDAYTHHESVYDRQEPTHKAVEDVDRLIDTYLAHV